MAEVGVFVHWRRYCYGAGRSVYLDGQDPWADQEEILRFVTHQAYNSHYVIGRVQIVMIHYPLGYDVKAGRAVNHH